VERALLHVNVRREEGRVSCAKCKKGGSYIELG